ncbi:MAG: PAC2 family protein [Bifidobacteriaceae bacterium]|jgi:hypothetical protein|nr:PAC2 family protein [Bifidobacteriaceae bacterium]
MSARPSRPETTAIACFAGWNDAGGAATDALEYLADQWDATLIASIDPDDYYDFQVMRPRFEMNENRRELVWPRTRLYEAQTLDGKRVLLVDGIEPSMRWMDYTAELLELLLTQGVTRLLLVGALLADVPHTRDITVTVTSSSAALRQEYAIERSDYTGSTGIVGVLEHTANEDFHLPAFSLWAAVPHYVATPPSPKVVMAIVTEVGKLLNQTIDLGDLPDDATRWVEMVDEIASDDEDMAEYVRQLENAKDTVDSPEASGEAIAREFQRYLLDNLGNEDLPDGPPS